MKSLSEFLANHLGIPELDLSNAIDAYKKYLQNDLPKTVQWAMVENQLIIALEKMEGAKDMNHTTKGFASSVSNCDCRPIGMPCIHNVKHPICPLNLYFEGDLDCNPRYCDWTIELRSCSNACKINTDEAELCISIDVPRIICEFPDAYSKETSCKKCPLK